MAAPDDQMESLVARCVDAGDDAYGDVMEQLCAAHPALATDLRLRIRRLEQLGFLGRASREQPSRWWPDRIGAYQITGLLGRGGMGVVFRGRGADGVDVAIKIVRPDLLTDDRARERFRREALLAARLRDPGICPVLEVGLDDDVPYLVMPLLQGRTFGSWVRTVLPARHEILAVLEGHSRALHAAHEAGLVHRDVTPGNLFVTEDAGAMVLDFGLARDTTGDVSAMTLSQELIGTLPYMAPEQIRGDPIDRRTDVYALGVVLYEALSGRQPFVGRMRSDVSRRILSGEAPRLIKIARDVPRSFERVVQTAMDLAPSRRYATALEFADDLQRLRTGLKVAARGVGSVVRLRRWAVHHPVATTAILLLGLLLAVASAFLVELSHAVRIRHAAERSLESRSLEQADPMRSIVAAIDAYEGDANARSLGQLNRVLQNVSLLTTATVGAGDVRGVAVCRLDERSDRVAVITDRTLSLWTLDRSTGEVHEQWSRTLPASELLACVALSPNARHVVCGGLGKVVHGMDTVSGAAWSRIAGATPQDGMQGQVWSVHVGDAGEVWAADVRRQLWFWPGSEASELVGRAVFDVRDPSRPKAQRFPEPIRGLAVAPGGDALLWQFAWAWRLHVDGTVVWRWPPTGTWEDPQQRTNGSMNYTAQVDEAADRVLLCQLGEARVLRWSDGNQIWAAPERSANDAAMAVDGTVATLHPDGVVRLWRDGSQPVAMHSDAEDRLCGVLAIPGQAAFLLVGSGGTRTQVDGRGRVLRTLRGGDLGRWAAPGPFALSSDGATLVASGGAGRVRTWDLDGSRGGAQLRLVASPPVAMSRHPDGRRLLIVTEDHRVVCWDPQRNSVQPVGELPFAIRGRSAGAAGEHPLFGGMLRQGPRLAVFEPATSSLRFPVRFDLEPAKGGQYAVVGAAWLSPERVAIACGDNPFAPGRIRILDATGVDMPFAKALRADLEMPADVGRLECLDAAQDGKTMAFGTTSSGIHVWRDDGAGFRSWRSASTGGRRVWSIDLGDDGAQLAASCEDGSVLAWNLRDEKPRILVPARDRPSRCVLGDAGRVVVEFAADGLVSVWDIARGACLFETTVGEGAVVTDAVVLRVGLSGANPASGAIAETADLRLATVASDGWGRVWSFAGAELLAKARLRLQALERR